MQDVLGERVATLESITKTLAQDQRDREAYQREKDVYQTTVIESLAQIKEKQTQFLDYTKECEAKRDAHDKRLKILEDDNIRQNQLESKVTANTLDIAALKEARKTQLDFRNFFTGLIKFMAKLFAALLAFFGLLVTYLNYIATKHP